MSQQFPEEEVISVEEMRRNVGIQTALALVGRSADPSNVETLLGIADKVEKYLANGVESQGVAEDKPLDA